VVARDYGEPLEMKWTIDTDAGLIARGENGAIETMQLYSTEGFEELSKLWLKVGWNQKHVYTFSWLGRPIIQLPEDLVRIQELLHRVQPDVIVECGVAHGGSLIYYASLCKLADRGRVVGIDIDIRPHNRAAIEAHPLSELITLIEGSSVAPETVAAAAAEIQPGEKVLVILDSNHTREHVRAELEAYGPLVSVGSYAVVMDGIMRLVADTPRGRPEWHDDNPIVAVEEFVADHSEFVVEQPAWDFDESELRSNVTHWPQGYLRRVR
jgi:cephalosporin hydroxylase